MLDLGPYAVFVWPAYALTVVIMGGLVGVSVRRLKRQQRALRDYEATVGRRRRDSADEDRDEDP